MGSYPDDLLALLRQGELTLTGLMPWSSNTTFLGVVRDGEHAHPVIYKPMRGERPLWDFPHGTLAKREVAAFVVCQALGWSLVPPTVLREGPHGMGSVQLFVELDQSAHFITFNADPAYRWSLQALAAFDIAANNADRKAGHCLAAAEGRVVAIDQGLCFHVESKLRTVIWDFAGQPVPDDLACDLRRVADELNHAQAVTTQALLGLVSRAEVNALHCRIEELLAAGCYPAPPDDRRSFPWPLV